MKKIFTLIILISINALRVTQVNAQANSFAWAIKTGAQFDDSGFSIVTDNSGNVYTTGYFEGTTDFDPGSGTFNLTSAGLGDIFIQKLSPGGTFLWAKRMGGTGFDYGYSITIDASGNVITTGSFDGTADFDPGTTTFNLTSGGGHDVFIQKLDASGNFLWATNVGGTGEDEGLSATTDLNQNVIVTGYYSNSVDFDPGSGVNTHTSNGLYDNYIIKFDAGGNYLWAVTFGGTNYDYSKSVATDASGNIFTTGTFGGTVDFNPGAGDSSLTSNGGSIYGDIYIQKLEGGGNFMWVRQMGWFGDDIGTCIKTDVTGNIYTTGWFQVTVDFDPGVGVANLTTDGGGYTDDIFVQKLDGNGNFVWAKNMGGPSDDRSYSLTLDNAGYVCTTGYHSGTGDFDPGSGTSNLSGDGTFLSKLTNAGNFVWAKQMTTSEGHCITSDLVGNLYSTGQFDHTVDFDPGSGSYTLSSNAGSIDVYVQKLNSPSVGIAENSFDYSSDIYPNPTRGEFSIDLEKNYTDLNIEIKKVTGNIVYKSTLTAASIIKINLDQPAGIYFVSVITNGLNRNYKLIKQ